MLQEEPLVIPAGIVDLDSFRRWSLSPDFPQTGKIDFIAGNIEVDMSPANVWKHSSLKTDLGIELGGLVRQLGKLFIDQTRVVSPAAGLSREPDIVFVSWESLKSGRVVLRPGAAGPQEFMELEGGPDLIVEVVSPSSVTKDTRRLPPIYFLAGVGEYWIADARADEPTLTIMHRGKQKFEAAKSDAEGFQHSKVLGSSFRLTSQPGPVPHSIVYTLHRR
ncbi:MAG TPA: Uma2 family endonuclease [Planctomycetota bacterium]